MPYPFVQSIQVEKCKVCDVGVDPLDVPQESCGHDRYTHCQMTDVDFVPRRDYDAALAVIKDLVEHESRACWLDHHGYCQEHGWFGDEECSIARGRKLVGLDDE